MESIYTFFIKLISVLFIASSPIVNLATTSNNAINTYQEVSPIQKTMPISKIVESFYEDKSIGEVKTQTNTSKEYLSQDDLLALAGPNPTKLPLGDNKYTTNSAKKGYVYLCNARKESFGAFTAGPWISGGYWYPEEKISVEGAVSWPNAVFKNIISGLYRTLSSNGLPINHTTGNYPIASSDKAYSYDRNPNGIKAQTLKEALPVNPTITAEPNCMSGEVGFMLSGVPLYNAFDATLRDAAAYEVQDSCDGHPQVTGQYHYHSESSCFKDESVQTVLGFALDGFPITGGKVADNKYLLTDDLDICHGLTSEIVLDGKRTIMYHYVMTADFPYSVSCFKGKPTRVNPTNTNAGGMGNTNTLQGTNTNNRTPPQEAITACASSQENDKCSVQTPQGVLTGFCRKPPGITTLACVPDNI